MRIFVLLRTFIRRSFQQESAFRANALFGLLDTTLALAGGLGGIAILFAQVHRLNGWSFPEVLAVLGVYMLIDSVRNLVFGPSLGSIAGIDGDLWMGRFDYTLLKPVPVQFYVSFCNWRPWALVDLTVSIGLLFASIAQMGASVTALRLGLFLAALAVCLTLMYAVLLLLVSGAFWYLGAPLIWIYDSLIQMGRFPVRVYPAALRFILTWIIPVGFIVSIPAGQLVGRAGLAEIGVGLILAVLLFTAASLLFRTGIKRYASASS